MASGGSISDRRLQAELTQGPSGSDLLTTRFPVFPLLLRLEGDAPRKAVQMFLVVECLQPAALVLNPRWGWGWLVQRLAEAFYFIQIPFWDKAYVHSWGLPEREGFFWAVVLISFLSWVALLVYLRRGGETTNETVFAVVQGALHLLAGVLFQPSCNFLLSMMACGTDGKLWQTADVDCWGALHYIHVIAGIFALGTLLLLTLIIRSCVYGDNPNSLGVRARAHSLLDPPVVVFQFVSSILYFELLSKGRSQLFACLLCIAAFALAVAHAVLLPYFNSNSNELVVGIYLFTAAVSGFAASPVWELVERDADAVMLAGLAFCCWFIAAYSVRRMRISRHCAHALSELTAGRWKKVEQFALFPSRLPSNDMRWSEHHMLEQRLNGDQDELLGNSMTSGASPHLKQGDQSIQLLRAYVSTVLFPTDVELATRFLREFGFAVGAVPTPRMLAFASRIFTKGISKFPESSLVKLHFVSFLHHYCALHPQALVEVRNVQLKMHCSIVVSFRLFVLSGKLRKILCIRDASDERIISVSRRLHKQALQSMFTFWSKLLSEKVSPLDLVKLADTIAAKRQQGLQMMERVVRTRYDRAVTTNYAQFLEEVMLDPAAADEVRTKLKEMTHKQQAGIVRQEAVADNMSLASTNRLDAQQHFVEQIVEVSKSASTVWRGDTRSTRVRALMMQVNTMFAVFLCIIIAFGIYDTILSARQMAFVKQMQTAGQARMLSQFGSWYARELQNSATKERNALPGCANVVCSAQGQPMNTLSSDCAPTEAFFPETIQLRTQFGVVLQRLRTAQDKLTHGEHSAEYAPLVNLFKEPRRLIQEFALVTSDPEIQLMGLWKIMTQIVQHLETIYSTNLLCAAENGDTKFLEANLYLGLAQAYNESLNLAEERGLYDIETGSFVLLGLFASSLVVGFCVYLTLIVRVLRVSAAKMTTVGLFFLIPKNALAEVHASAQQSLARFETHSTGDDDSEDDEDEFMGQFEALYKNKAMGEGKLITHQDQTDSSELQQQNDFSASIEDMGLGGRESPPGGVNDLVDEEQGSDGRRMSESGQVDEAEKSVAKQQQQAEQAAKREENFDEDLREPDDDSSDGKDAVEAIVFGDDEDSKKRLQGSHRRLTELIFLLSLLCAVAGLATAIMFMSETRRISDEQEAIAELHIRRVKAQTNTERAQDMALSYVFGCQFKGYSEYWELVGQETVMKNLLELGQELDEKNGKMYSEIAQWMERKRKLEERAMVYANLQCQYEKSLEENRPVEDIRAEEAHLFRDITEVDISAFNPFGDDFFEGGWTTDYPLKGNSGARAWVHLFAHSLYVTWEEGSAGGWTKAIVEYIPIPGEANTGVIFTLQNGTEVPGFVTLKATDVAGVKLGQLEFIVAGENMMNVSLYQEAGQVAGLLLSQKEYTAAGKRVVEIFNELPSESVHISEGKLFMTLTIITHACAAFFLIVLIIRAHTHPVLSEQGVTQKVFIALLLLLYIAVTVMVPLAWAYVDELETVYSEAAAIDNSERIAREVLLLPRDSVVRFAITHNLAYATSYVNVLEDESVTYILDTIMRMHVPGVDYKGYEWKLPFKRREKLYGTHAVLPLVVEKMREVEKASLTMTMWSSRTEVFDVLKGVRWNVMSDPEHDKLAERYPLESWFNETIADSTLSRPKLAKKARELMYEPAYEAVREEAMGMLHSVIGGYGGIRELRMLAAAKDREHMFQEVTAALVLSAAAAAVYAIYCSSLVFTVLKVVSQSDTADRRSRGQGGQRLFPDLVRRMKVALFFVAIVMAVLFGVGFFTLRQSSETGARLNYASSREFLVARGMVAMQTLQYGRSELDLKTRHVTEVPDDLMMAEDRLLFGQPSAAGYAAAGRDPATDKDLFGADTTTDHRIECKTLYPFEEAGTSVGARLISSLMSQGAYDNAQNTYDILKSGVVPLLENLERSSQRFVESAESAVSERRAAFLSILIVAAALLLLECIFVFTPIVNELGKEEEASQTLLHMIPPHVRESVGAIHEFMETGFTSQNQRLQTINEVIVSFTDVPTFVTDSAGTILRASKSALRMFEYEDADVLGKNVKMLMPDDIAVRHDGFLKRYRLTGVKRIIDSSTRSRGQRKDGVIFDVRISPKSFRNNGKQMFIAFVDDIGLEIQTERTARLNDAVSMTSSVPVICIDELGHIMRWNNAASETFMYSSSEVLGANIKMLMPPNVSRRHDGYLSRYRKYRVKHVIDRTARQRGVRKNGESFPCQLFIKETRWKGGEHLYIGYVRDVTEEAKLRQSVLLNECVLSVSQCPLIMANTVGQIVRVAPSTCKTWGYEMSELQGNNVKALMPPSVAEKHDTFLTNYIRTGQKRVIDTSRRAQARRKDHSMFEVMLTVKEVKSESTSFPSLYIAYVIDLTQQLLRQEESTRTELIANLCPLPIITLDHYGHVKAFNRAAEKLTEYSLQEVQDKSLDFMMPPEIGNVHDSFIKNYFQLRQKRVLDTTLRQNMRNKKQEVFPVDITAREVVTPEGESIFIGCLQDRRQKQVMEQLTRENTTVTELVTVPLIVITATGLVQVYSRQAANTFGWVKDEILLRNVSMLMPDETAERHDEILRSYIARRTKAGEPIASTVVGSGGRKVVAQRKDGDIFPAEISVREVIDDTGFCFIACVREITIELRETSETLVQETILNLSPVPVVVIDTIGTILTFSDAAIASFGYTIEEALHQNVKMLQPPNVAMNHDKYLSTYLKTGIKSVIDTSRNVEGKRKDGHVFPAQIVVREIFVKDLVGRDDQVYVGYIKDLTRESLLGELRTVNDVATELASIPMLTVGITGKVLKYNAAAARDFGWTVNEIQGRNVKVIMTDDVASKHDQYLAEYRKTRKQKVIGRITKVTAKRKDGSFFTSEVSVRELGIGGRVVYMGYVRDITEEVSLQEEAKFSIAVTELSLLPIIQIDHKGTVLTFNQAAGSTFNYDVSDVMGQNIKMLQTEEVSSKHDKYLRNYLQTGIKKVVGTTRLVTALRSDRSTFMAMIMVREIRLDPDRPPVFVGFLRDVTEDRKTESAAFLASTVNEMLPVPCIVMNHAGVVIRFSKSACSDFGYTADEVEGQNIKMLQPPEVAEKHDGYLSAYLRTGIKHVINSSRESVALRKNGTLMPVDIGVREVRRQGELPLYIGYVRDLTNDKAVEENRRTLELIFEMSPCALIAMDIRGSVKKFNKAAEELFQVSRADINNQNVKILMPEHIAIHHDGYLKKYLETRVKSIIDTTRKIEGKRKDQTIFPATVTVREIIPEESERMYVGFVLDASMEGMIQQQHEMNTKVTALSPIPILAITELGTIEQVSDSVTQTFRYENSDELIGQNVKMLMPNDIAIRHDGFLKRYLETGIKKVIDTTNRLQAMRKDGTQFTSELSIRECIWKGSRSYIGYVRDLSAEIEEQRLHIIDNVVNQNCPVSVLVINPKGKILQVNTMATDFFGLPEAELVGAPIEKLQSPDTAAVHQNYLDSYHARREGNESVRQEMEGKTRRVKAWTKDSGEVPVDLMIREVNTASQGRVFVASVADASETRALHLYMEMNGAMLQLVEEATVAINSTGIIMEFNKSAELMFDRQAAQTVGQNVKILMPPDIAAEHDGYLATYARTGVKSVVDTSREVIAMTAKGVRFDATIQVREVKLFVGREQTSAFVAFILRD
eukprot:Hpha_TRINITY_DN15556_c1_g9::TRINITY_DN15556_c1_g9_i1::g.106886::m.106886